MNDYLLGADENLTRDGNDVSPKTGRRQDLRKGRDKNWSGRGLGEGDAKTLDENLSGAGNNASPKNGRRQSGW